MGSETKYRILQYNVLHQKPGWTWMHHLFEIPFRTRAENVARAISDCAPDVVLPAEHHDEWGGVDTEAAGGSVELVKLIGNGFAIAEAVISCDGESAVNRTPILYNAKRFRCLDSGFLKLTEEATFHNSQNKRGVTWAVLEDVSASEAQGVKIAVFNTHWSFAEYKGNSLAHIREAQTKEMQELINRFSQQGIPVVAGGDFNAVYSDSIYTDLLEGCGMQDADMTANGRITRNIVDHIAAAGVTLASYVIYPAANASDHDPVYCDVILQK